MTWNLVAQISVLMLVASLCAAALRGNPPRKERNPDGSTTSSR